MLTDLLGVEVPVNRQTFRQQYGQSALVLKMDGRLPEGVVLDRAAMEEMGYTLRLLTRRLLSSPVPGSPQPATSSEGDSNANR